MNLQFMVKDSKKYPATGEQFRERFGGEFIDPRTPAEMVQTTDAPY
jgi:hypothetical protein